jgi:hypothetical protein
MATHDLGLFLARSMTEAATPRRREATMIMGVSLLSMKA